MRAITLHRPWDWAMAHGGKNIENRPWAPWSSVIGTRIALHAGKHFDEEGARSIASIRIMGTTEIENMRASSKDSVIVATTELVGYVRITTGRRVLDHGKLSSEQLLEALESPWLFGPFGWLVRGTVALPEPVPCKGALGLWKLPPAVEREVLRQEEAVMIGAITGVQCGDCNGAGCPDCHYGEKHWP